MVNSHLHHPRIISRIPPSRHQSTRVISFLVYWQTEAYVLSQYGRYWWYRHVCAIGAVFNILMMLSANLVGFVIGTEGIGYMAKEIVGSWEGTSLARSLLIRSRGG